jgi:BirA family biotin operon repressor/biotin-[acetyl-CoA-carboxylase] ligase
LVVGLAVQRALQALGARELKLKWPNDLVTARFEKLGGILVELRAEADGPGHVVIGIGLNLRLADSTREKVAAQGTSAADLESLGLDSAARNTLVAHILDECVAALLLFGQEGFKPFAAAWSKGDALRDQPVRLLEASSEVQGIARGIDAQGALKVEMADGTVRPVWSAEVSVRTRSV